MEELRAKADIQEAETQKLEAANADLRRSLQLRAEQKAELVQQSERSLRELEARWVVEGRQVSWGPSDCETTGETPTGHQGQEGPQLLLSWPSHAHIPIPHPPVPGPVYTDHLCVNLTQAFDWRLLSRERHAALRFPGLKGVC